MQLIEQVFYDASKDIERIFWECEKYWQCQSFTNPNDMKSVSESYRKSSNGCRK